MIEASNRVLAGYRSAVPATAPAVSVAETPAPETIANESSPAEAVAASKDFKLFGEKGFGFRDIIDIINPLQHIPIVSTIYRRVTGDELSPGARIVGDTLFTGPIGAAVALVDTAVEYKTGRDIGGNALAMLMGDEQPDTCGTAIAAATDSKRSAGSLATASLSSGGGSALSAGFTATAAPDLGALSAFATGAGPNTGLGAGLVAGAPVQLEPKFEVEPWQAPPMPVASAIPFIPATTAMAAPSSPATIAVPAASETAAVAQPPVDTPARPMPSQAASAQAINALAQMPTSQTTAAIAELASNDPHPTPRRHMAPPAGDIPRGAGPTLTRSATRAYAASMAKATPAIEADSATAVAEVSRSTAAAQNDWIVNAMQDAMAKYEAGARLRSANIDSAPSVSVSR